MNRDPKRRMRKYLIFSIVGLLAFVEGGRAQNPTDVQARLDAQEREIQELKEMMRGGIQPGAAANPSPVNPAANNSAPPSAPSAANASPVWAVPIAGAPFSNVEGKENKGECKSDDSKKAASDPGFKVGYDGNKGFYFDAANDEFPKLEDGTYPFELRVHGRIQLDYYGYKVNDQTNHLAGVNSGAPDSPDESVLEVKRMRLIFAGWMFDQDLRYQIQFDGNTRGLNTEATRQNAFNNPVGNIEGGANIGNVDAGVRLLEAWIAYDFHGEADAHGYRDTFTLIAGKLKPMGSFEEYLGSANGQFVEFGMSSWMFDSDADNFLTGAGFQIHALEDRFFAMALITNGSDNQVPNYNMGDLPGVNVGWWYDFGGTWDDKTQRWKLYGDSISDIDWSENPVLRVGTAADLVWIGRRSQYTSAQLDFFKAATAAPGGSNVDSVLGGSSLGTEGNFKNVANGNSPFAVDAFDVYTYDFFYTGHYQGFSFYNEWWIRDYDNFQGEQNATTSKNYPILYSFNTPKGTSSPALFNRGGMVDIGTAVQTGYFLIPHKLELAFRYDLISGESGDINGDGTYKSVSASSLGIKEAAAVGGVQPANTVPLGTNIKIVNGAFSHFHNSQEIAIGLNVFMYGEKVKWQTDVGTYTGGNPASNGQSPAGYIPGVNGYMVRTQLQFSF